MNNIADKSDDRESHVPTSLDPRLLQAMYGQYEEDEIDLLEYWNLIWKKRVLILGAAFMAALVAAVISLMMPNIYRAEALLAPTGGEESKNGLS